MLQLSNISLAFGGQQVLDGVTWTLRTNQRIGLVGPNGAGKTTLLRIIAGRQRPDSGEIALTGGMSIGYLEQDVQETPAARTVLEEALKAFDDILALEAEEIRITAELEASDDHETDEYHKLLVALEKVHSELIGRESHRIRSQTEAVLSGLGFADEDLARPLRTFSGGWRMRVVLAKLLLRRPDFLLLDEPTNHLDIDSIDWLENFLRSYSGTVVIVSHDRYFLDRMVTTVAEMAAGAVTEYAGNYAFYLEDRQLRRAQQQAAFDNQQREIAQMERFVERFRAKATKAKQAQSRIKTLEKMDRLAPPPSEASSISFRFPEPERSGKVVAELSHFSKTYQSAEGDIAVFDHAGPLVIERGSKIALIGKNGAGKSTLARMLNGTEPFEGELRLGYNTIRTYFAQHQADALEGEDTILDAMRVVSRGQSETQIRSLLGAFLFTGDSVFKKVAVLSGGEKSRVALARTLLHPANFMILDEPTNHLDIASINVLIEALRQYSGTFVVVSHDRHFVDQVVNGIWRVEDGGVRTFAGNYSDYLWQIQHGTAAKVETPASAAAPASAPVSTNGSSGGGPKTKEQKRLEAEERNRRYRDASPAPGPAGKEAATDLSPQAVRRQYGKLESDILKREARQEEVERELAAVDLYQDPARLKEKMAEYEKLKKELESMYHRWESLADVLAGQAPA